MKTFAFAALLVQRPRSCYRAFGNRLAKLGLNPILGEIQTYNSHFPCLNWWATNHGVIDDGLFENHNTKQTRIVTLGSTYLAVDNDRIAYWGSGIPQGLFDKLWGRQEYLPGIDVVTIGADKDSYFVQFIDGDSEWSGVNEYLSSVLSSYDSMVHSIALGPNENYFCLWRDDRYVWSSGVPVDFDNQLKSRKKDLPGPDHVSLGQNDEWFIRYKDGTWRCGNISESCNKTIKKIHGNGNEICNIEFGHTYSWIITYRENFRLTN